MSDIQTKLILLKNGVKTYLVKPWNYCDVLHDLLLLWICNVKDSAGTKPQLHISKIQWSVDVFVQIKVDFMWQLSLIGLTSKVIQLLNTLKLFSEGFLKVLFFFKSTCEFSLHKVSYSLSLDTPYAPIFLFNQIIMKCIQLQRRSPVGLILFFFSVFFFF